MAAEKKTKKVAFAPTRKQPSRAATSKPLSTTPAPPAAKKLTGPKSKAKSTAKTAPKRPEQPPPFDVKAPVWSHDPVIFSQQAEEYALQYMTPEMYRQITEPKTKPLDLYDPVAVAFHNQRAKNGDGEEVCLKGRVPRGRVNHVASG